MPPPIDGARLAAARSRFAAFFGELHDSFAEREDVLAQLALALLAREHVLLAGPPGTAKSALASAVLGRILDENTGRPSLYARQLTESTVQTDVIGPVDFKTLMETGRTEHFTDEGLLGAVHAFLDEVFDGRDMLLRSTLNLLHERELKQGTQIARGRFEIAFMTTNRYVAEVLESARETLLAFIDRIAFIGFVPRGFSDAARLSQVLRREIGGVGRPPLEAALTVQDLDALQAVADSVLVPEPVCDALARLLDLLEIELQATQRADPAFLPTRYLSTRTAVRSGKILRAIVVHDAIFRRPDRPLCVERDDLKALRLHLLLSGPSLEHAGVLLGRERDPREKRQLTILRAEREAFERAFAKLPPIKATPAPSARSVFFSEPAPAAEGSFVAAAAAAVSPAAPSRPWAEAAERALTLRDPAAIARALRGVLSSVRAPGEEAALAKALCRRGVTALRSVALQTTLAARTSEVARPEEIVREVVSLAGALDEGPASTQALARWVRGQALVLLAARAAKALDVGQENAAAWATERDAAPLLAEAETKLRAVEQLAAERARLVAAGVEPALRHEADALWLRGLAVVAEDLSALCDAALRTAATATLEAGAARGLRQLLGDVGAALALLQEIDRRARAVELPTSLRTSVIAPRIAPLLAHTFGRVEARDRVAYVAEVDSTLRVLEEAGLADVVPPEEWLTWAARAILRADSSEAASVPAPPDHGGYRRLRASNPRAPGGFLLAEVALRTSRGAAFTGDPAQHLPAAAELLEALPANLRRGVAAADRLRIEQVIALLEQFWLAVDDGSEAASPQQASARIGRIVESRIFAVLLDEGAASRTQLEIELLRELFPEEVDAARALQQRLDGLVARVRRCLLALVRARGEGAWSAALERASAAEPAPA